MPHEVTLRPAKRAVVLSALPALLAGGWLVAQPQPSTVDTTAASATDWPDLHHTISRIWDPAPDSTQ
jgi:hypothetical protein